MTGTQLTIAERIDHALAGTKSEADLKALAASTADISAITNKDGREQVHSAMMVLKRTRVELKTFCETVRDEANKFARGVIARQKELVALIEPEESRLQKLRDDWDAAREAERQAAIAAEEQRVEALEERVAELRGNRMLSPTSGSQLIAGHIEDVERIVVDGSFQEYENQAREAKEAGLKWLRELHVAAVAHEEEQKRIREERAELARLREEEQKRQAAERARIAEEERQARAAREAEARQQAEELRKQREAQGAENARIRAEQEAAARAERDRIAEENRRLAAERAEFQRQQDEARQKREAEERDRAEQARIAALKRPDDTELVDVLAKHYRAPTAKVIEWLAATNWKKAKAA